ncbi:MAG: hypothetical protein ACI37Z_01360 [Candidatus Gastranaerophilaceae bacterium]
MVNSIQNVDIAKLTKILQNAGVKQEKIDEATKLAEDHVLSQDEITQILALAPDGKIELNAENLTLDDANVDADNVGKGKYAGMSKDKVVAQITEDIGDLGQIQGDAYSSGNPYVGALGSAVKGGLVEELFNSGFNKSEVADIIGSAFKGTGIKGNGAGGYTVPYGHDNQAKEIYNKLINAMANAAATAAGNVDFANDDKIKELQGQIDANNVIIQGNNFQITANNAQIEKISAQIQELKTQAEGEIEQAIKDSNEIAETSKAQVQDAISRRLDEYANSQGAMTYEDFRANVAGEIDGIDANTQRNLKDVTCGILDANDKLSQIDGLLGNLGALLAENSDLLADNNNLANINSDLASQIEERTEVLKAEAAANSSSSADSDSSRCDPIGFENGGKKFDFFEDKDGDGQLSNASEFLGAEDGWDEMKKLDVAGGANGGGDGKITKAELMENPNLKMVVTDANGNQEIKSVAEVFAAAGDNDVVIDLNSYKEVNADVNENVHMLGKFKVDLDGIGDADAIDGYNTLDTLDYLNANYDFSDADKLTAGSDTTLAGSDAITKDNFNINGQTFEELEAEIANLHDDFEAALSKIGMDEADIETFTKAESKNAQDYATNIQDKFDSDAAKEEMEKLKAEREARAQQAAELAKAEEANAAEEAAAEEEANAADEANTTEEDPNLANWEPGQDAPAGYTIDPKTGKPIKLA